MFGRLVTTLMKLANPGADTVRVLQVVTEGTNGATHNVFVGNRSPIGVVTGSPGDKYIRVQGVSTAEYLHTGAGADNTSWVNTGRAVLQTTFDDVAVDTTTTATTFPGSTLLTRNITIAAGSSLLIYFSSGSTNTNNGRDNFFRLVVDGVVRRGVASACGGTDVGAVAIVSKVTGLAAGARTVAVQWRTSANTGRIRPVTTPDQEHASLVIMEVTN